MPDQVVLSTHPLHPDATAALAAACQLRIADSLAPERLIELARDAVAVIVRANLPPELFAAASRMKLAVRHGAGLDMIPVDAATRAGILVANLPGVNARSVAEHVLFVTLALLRRFRQVDGDLRTKGWLAGREHATATQELAGRRMGIVGYGAVGRQVRAIAESGFGLVTAVTNRSQVKDGPTWMDLDALCAWSDVLVLCCPLTAETRGMIDARRIASMRPGALIVNVARGAVIDDPALIAALGGGRIGGAALDVFATQPLPSDHPYFGFANVILTPHMAGITEQSMRRMGLGAADEVLRVLRGELPLNLRNPEALPAFHARFPQSRRPA